MNKPAAITGSSSTRSLLSSKDEAIAAARAMAERVRSRASRTEDERRVPVEIIKALNDSGLFGVVTPKVFGGSELGFSALLQSTIEIASACGSTGWVYGVLAGHSWLLNLFPIKAQEDIMLSPNPLTATVFRLGGTVTKVDGGYRLVDGDGRFCSGVDHADWVIVGNAVQREGLPPERRFFAIARSDIEIVDDWHTIGMRGTGSKTIKVKDAFIPDHRSATVEEMVSGKSPGASFHTGPLYRMPFSEIAPFSIVGAPLGMALGASRFFAASLASRMTNSSELDLAESSPTLTRIAVASAQIDAAIALVVADADRIDAANDPSDLSPLDWAKIPRNWAYAVQTCRNATNSIFEAAGGSGIYNHAEIQRFWRDANAAGQHFAFTWDNAMSNFGRVLVGKPPVAYQLKRR